MTSPRALLDAAQRLASQSGSLFELRTTLYATGTLDLSAFEAWTRLLQAAQALGISGTIEHDDAGGPIALDHFDSDTRTFSARVTLEKPVGSNEAYFFTIDGLRTVLGESSYSEVRIATASQERAFSTTLSEFVPWVARMTPLAAVSETPLPDPRLFARDLGDHIVPDRIDCWLLRTPPAVPDSVYDAWVHSASCRLIAALANDVTRAQDEHVQFVVRLRGVRSVDIAVSKTASLSTNVFSQLQDAARWVYASGGDVETRHILFTDALAREWYEQATWQAGFPKFGPRALASARNAYRRHLSETSAETLKSLDELRKSLSDDIAKVTQQTRDLTSSLWRDFAIVFTALAGRAALIVAGNPIADSVVIRGLMLIAAVYALISILLTLVASARFDAVLRLNRSKWRERLFAFLLPDELTALADEPLNQTSMVYRDNAIVVSFAYVLMIAAVVLSTVYLSASSNGKSQSGTAFAPKHPAAVSKSARPPAKQPASGRTPR